MTNPVPVLRRTNYADPSQVGAVQIGEAAVDFAEYNKPLEQIHGSSLHGWGIASGLAVTGVIGQQGLHVTPGVALDSAGQHIYLAVGGYAQTGPPASPTTTPNTQSSLIPQPFISPSLTNPNPSSLGVAGVALPTSGLSGTMYLTIQFCETPDASQPDAQTDHTPWLRLVSKAPTDGSSLVLAEVTLDPSANVTNLVAGPRQGLSLPVQRLSVFDYGVETTVGTSKSVGTTPLEIGALLPRDAGGLTIQGDTIGIRSSTSGTETVSIDVVAGNAHVRGSIIVDGKVNGRDILIDGQNLDSHLANHSNPHQVTPAQIGALPIQGGTLSGGLNINQSLVVAGNLAVHGTIQGSLAPSVVGTAQIRNNAIVPGQLAVSPYFGIRCHDFLIGESGVPGRSPNMRRALVDGLSQLVVNWGPDWPTCLVNKFVAGSSAKMKDDIVDLKESHAEEILNGLRPRSFRFKDERTGPMRHGFVAEEAPEAVASAEKTGIFLDGIIASLVVVVTELQQRVRVLEQRLSAVGDPQP